MLSKFPDLLFHEFLTIRVYNKMDIAISQKVRAKGTLSEKSLTDVDYLYRQRYLYFQHGILVENSSQVQSA